MKINVVGTSGSGKSTSSRRLATQLAIPYIEMDTLFWQPNWTPSNDEDFFCRLEQGCWTATTIAAATLNGGRCT
ncbi:Shikimate kinase [Sodalis glossinidius str. 'morsitans']|uniref:Shikimate kinase n=1 Tax=Sodalis glossinidius (strain morsitans) TaxID=343509 RepID=A0A193QGA5_SODGM|nr:Shikimate kinase [Sodalis glossinidius str. 'morsitans']